MNIANPGDHDWARRLWRFQFGVGGAEDTVYVWANGVDTGLEVAGDWLEDHAPGHLVDPYLALKDDLTYTPAGWILSSEWWVDEVHPGTDLFTQATEASRDDYDVPPEPDDW